MPERLERHFLMNSKTQYTQVDGRLRSLFFASQEQVELARCYLDIVLMDSTYKSNRYNMPLLHFGGVTPNNTFYSAAFAFMSGESEEDFYWAIDQFKRLIHFDLQPPKCFVTDNDKGMRNAFGFYVSGISSRMFSIALS
jgi:hypothetical protein